MKMVREMFRANSRAAMLGMVLAACYAAAADATLVYSSPGTFNVSSFVHDNILVDNSLTTVNVNNGVILGVNDPSAGSFNTAVRTRRGNFNLNGSSVLVAASGQSAINMAGNGSVVRLRNNSWVFGDIVNEFTTPGWRNESTAITRLYLEDRTKVFGDIEYAGYLRIEDRATIVGDIRNPANGSMSLDMRGGVVTGSLIQGGLNDYVINMSGGVILGGYQGAPSYVDLTMTGGAIYNGFTTTGFVDGEIHGGSIYGGISIDNESTGGASHLTIDGGIFNADPGEYLLSMSYTRLSGSTLSASLDISGGEFGYLQDGLGFFLDEWVDFSIYGWDLTFTDGVLSGYLMDGSWFSSAFTFGSNWSGTFNIYNTAMMSALSAPLESLSTLASVEGQSVPEPGTLGLLAACGLAMMAFRRRRNDEAGEADARLITPAVA